MFRSRIDGESQVSSSRPIAWITAKESSTHAYLFLESVKEVSAIWNFFGCSNKHLVEVAHFVPNRFIYEVCPYEASVLRERTYYKQKYVITQEQLRQIQRMAILAKQTPPLYRRYSGPSSISQNCSSVLVAILSKAGVEVNIGFLGRIVTRPIDIVGSGAWDWVCSLAPMGKEGTALSLEH